MVASSATTLAVLLDVFVGVFPRVANSFQAWSSIRAAAARRRRRGRHPRRWSKRLLLRLANAGLWAAGATALYDAGVAWVGRANQKLEPAYATPPASPLVSGSPQSLLPFGDLGLQGRRFVSDVLTPSSSRR